MKTTKIVCALTATLTLTGSLVGEVIKLNTNQTEISRSNGSGVTLYEASPNNYNVYYDGKRIGYVRRVKEPLMDKYHWEAGSVNGGSKTCDTRSEAVAYVVSKK